MNLCDKCHKNTATVYVESVINGAKSEHFLCQECANTLEGNISFDNFLKSFLDTMISYKPNFYTESSTTTKHTEVCNMCGMTYEEFKQTSRLGCAGCYQAFRPQMEVVLKNIQVSNVHDGKIPNKSGAVLLYKKELKSLKSALNKAISDEEYEEAARLRDRIKELQANNNDKDV